MSGLRAREQELQSVEQGLAALQAEFDGAVKKKLELEFQVNICDFKVVFNAILNCMLFA
jgi:hypothetical protein